MKLSFAGPSAEASATAEKLCTVRGLEQSLKSCKAACCRLLSPELMECSGCRWPR